MADRSKFYGLKEVADDDLYPVGTKITIKKDGTVESGAAASYSFDTLKVTNIEATSEEVSARGGKGNPELISWSYGKEVNFTTTSMINNTGCFGNIYKVAEDDNMDLIIKLSAKHI